MKSKCEQCGKVIEKVVPWKKYCSTRCKQIAWALRQAGKLIDKKANGINREGDEKCGTRQIQVTQI